MKPYDVGLVCGRFQMFHKGHEKLVDTALMLCDRVLILVGSAQESGTERNPFNIATRIKMIKEIYGDEVMVYGLSDLTNENDIRPEWGKYLLDNAKRYIHKNPEIMIYGNDESRSNWFNKEDLANTTELIINRAELPISGTMCRDLMTLGHQEEWMRLVNPRLHKMWRELCDELQWSTYQNRMDEIHELLEENRAVKVVTGTSGDISVEPIPKQDMMGDSENTCRVNLNEGHPLSTGEGRPTEEPRTLSVPIELEIDDESACETEWAEIPIKECGRRKGKNKIKLKMEDTLPLAEEWKD